LITRVIRNAVRLQMLIISHLWLSHSPKFWSNCSRWKNFHGL